MKHIILLFLLVCSFQTFAQTDSKTKKLSQEEIKAFILVETKEGGKLDFFTAIKGKEYNGSQVKPGLFMTNIEMALYKWGKANFDLGVENIETALKIFEDYKGSKLDRRENEIIPMGYRNDLVK